MRKFSLFLLLATAAAPTLAAQDQDRGGRHHENSSSEQSESRPDRSNQNRSSEAHEQRTLVRRSESGSDQQGAGARVRTHFQQQQQTQSATTQVSRDSVRNWGGGEHRDAAGDMQTQSGWRERERHVRTIPDTNPTSTQPSGTNREAFQGRNHRDYHDGNYTRWSNNWRNDRRYDWNSYRTRHRSIFRLGFYNDPFGWNYRRWSIGSFLYPSFYGSNYWLNDPWQYRLPPAYGPYRWVRYWDDALLVNIYTGEVVDVMHNFFW
jgi:hypothetical protein